MKVYPALLFPVLLRRRPVAVVLVAAAVAVLGYLPHVLAVGARVVGYLPGYLSEERYGEGARYLLVGLTGLSGAAATVAVAAGVLALAVWAVRTRLPSADAGVRLLAGVLLLVTPVQPWYALLLVALVALPAGGPASRWPRPPTRCSSRRSSTAPTCWPAGSSYGAAPRRRRCVSAGRAARPWTAACSFRMTSTRPSSACSRSTCSSAVPLPSPCSRAIRALDSSRARRSDSAPSSSSRVAVEQQQRGRGLQHRGAGLGRLLRRQRLGQGGLGQHLRHQAHRDRARPEEPRGPVAGGDRGLDEVGEPLRRRLPVEPRRQPGRTGPWRPGRRR